MRLSRAIASASASIGLLALAACSSEEAAPAADDPAGPLTTASDDQPGVGAMLPVGEYRIAGADGAEVNLPHAMTVSITGDTIALVSQCVSPRWTYRLTGTQLTTKPIPEAMCDRGRHPAEEAAIAVFDAPDTILRTPSNGWYVAGGGHSITVFSQ